ncbi:hypothetical protein H257_14654 [Aphanomyces astaci]|uniref:DDE Tnp4 domain-containing protein n=1 Tax=Aphanomyces astaci TaxID=112090 RepID=W4FQ79_APHAT|nr:hypothetical protein H257_14654 [Aphanomyces astaci]ETV69632.1 hypothetical protein H257_14654 [Aphanomyces astaci]|eukprot:XP_009840848.1 hypothetical protein H257_14654 [Aphanomyces astaci]
MRMLTSGISAQELDDKFRLGSSTLLESLKRFCVALDQVYGVTVLRAPNDEDLNRLLDEGVQAGFPGCIGSIDCMHWQWKNCPSSWKGMFQGKEGVATVVLEAIADHRGRFWHFNFGTPGALNDIKVLDRSPLFHNAVNGTSPRVIWSLNGHEYNFPYWLADGIYPQFACFLKTYPNPSSRMQKLFASKQEAKRKDIERAFGVLQARFHVLTSGCRLWDRDAMRTVIKACVILHNMIIDFERETGVCPHYIHAVDYVPKHPFVLTAGQSDRRQRDDSGNEKHHSS